MVVRTAVEELLEAPVARASRVWGGYAPTPTFRLQLKDGRRAFIKGTHPELVEGAQRAMVKEKRVYEELSHLMGRWAPAYFGSIEVEGWKILALEDLGPKSAPPWSRRLAQKVLREYAAFHESTIGRDIPEWVPRPKAWASGNHMSWEWISESGAVDGVTGLAGSRSSRASSWLADSRDALAEAVSALVDPDLPQAFLHFDTRSDNLRWVSERLYLLDWPHVGVGPMEIDVVAFVQSITVEGGPDPEDLLAVYEKHLSLSDRAVTGAISGLAGYFTNQAGQPEIPELPRLRKFQRQQMKVTLQWVASRLGLPPPDWTESVDT
jgi:thiamine kinase-like enzyme